MQNSQVRESGWILCRNLQQIPIPHTDVLHGWAERGRLRPDDYLVNPGLEACVQAKDITDLNEVFRKARWRRLEKFLPFLGKLMTAPLKVPRAREINGPPKES
jgi:hypothetical protein